MMDYYMFFTDHEFSNRPIVKNWTQKFSIQELYNGNYSNIPNRVLLEIEENENVEFLDFLDVPFLMVSKRVKKVIEAYEPNMKFKEIVLLEKKHGLVGEYFLPLLRTKKCLNNKNCVGINKEEIVLSIEMLGDTSVFYIEGVERKAGVWREDIVETIMNRYVYGFQIKKIQTN